MSKKGLIIAANNVISIIITDRKTIKKPKKQKLEEKQLYGYFKRHGDGYERLISREKLNLF